MRGEAETAQSLILRAAGFATARAALEAQRLD
jgi:hypothetical protein